MPTDRTHAATEARRRRVGNGLLVGLGLAALLLAALDLVYERHPYFEVEAVTGFYAVVGAAACVLAVVLALPLRRLALRPEDDDVR